MVGFTRALAVDEAAHRITVNGVAPGWIATGSQLPSEYQQGLHMPLGRSGTAAEWHPSSRGWQARAHRVSPANRSSSTGETASQTNVRAKRHPEWAVCWAPKLLHTGPDRQHPHGEMPHGLDPAPVLSRVFGTVIMRARSSA